MNDRFFILSTLLLCFSNRLPAQNAVIFNDAYTQGGHSQGAIYVGGNWYGSNYEANQHEVDDIGIYLSGSNYITNFLRAKGTSFIGGTSGTFSGTLGSVETPDFSYYQELSDRYSSLENGISPDLSAMNNIVLTLEDEITVFNISASDLTGYKTLDFIGTGNIVINVTGNLTSWGWSVNYDPNKITWNFADATSINIDNRDFTGSIIAPNAHVTQSKSINGLLVADTWTVSGSADLRSYTAVDISDLVPTTAVPEPSSCLLGMAAFLLFLHRRR